VWIVFAEITQIRQAAALTSIKGCYRRPCTRERNVPLWVQQGGETWRRGPGDCPAGVGADRASRSACRFFRAIFLIHELREPFVRRLGSMKQESLKTVASPGKEVANLGLTLHPFRHHLELQVMGDRENGIHQGRIILVIRNVLDESPVDLQLLQRQALEIGKRGIAGTEIIDRETDADSGKLLHARYEGSAPVCSRACRTWETKSA
jgi:hypothetical protein